MVAVAIAEDRKRMSDFAQHFLMLHVEAQCDFRVLQVVIAGAGVRFVGAQRHAGKKQARKRDGGERGSTDWG